MTIHRVIGAALAGLTRYGLGLLLASAGGLGAPAVAQGGLNGWTTTGPEGGRIRALAVDPQTPGVLYAGTSGGEGVFAGGIFKTSTGGRIWVPLPPPVEAAISTVVIDPQKPSSLYAGTYGGLFKSTDGGMTWQPSNSGLSRTFISAMTIALRAPATLFAGTDRGVFKTTDGGASWYRSLAVDVLVLDLVIDPQTPTTIYAGTLLGVFKSTDGGATWSLSNTGLTNLEVFRLAIDPRTPSTLYTASQGAIFKSTNGGASWSLSNTGLINSYAVSLGIDPQTPEILYAGTQTGVFKSTDSGATWSPSSAGLPVNYPASVIGPLAIDPRSSTTLYAGSQGGGVFKSTDAGASWSPTNVSLRAVAIGGFFAGHPLAVDPQRPNILYASTENALFKSATGGASWVSSTSGLPGESLSLAIDPQTSTIVYAAPNAACPTPVFKSTDGGATWSSSRAGLPNDCLGPMAIDPNTPATLYVGTLGTGVFKSTNGGTNWQASNSGLPDNGVSDIAIDPRTPATLYTGTSGGGMFKSTDRGASWRPSNTGLTDTFISAVVIDPQTPTTLYAGTGGGVFKSVDGGALWRPSMSGLAGGATTALAIDPQTPTAVYAGTAGGGLFKSTNGGASWGPFNGTGLSNLVVNALTINSTGSCLHVGTRVGVFSFATRLDSGCLPPPPLVAAVLPTSRSVQVGTEATLFASITNASRANTTALAGEAVDTGVEAVACGVTQLTGLPTPFVFQATDPMTNQPMGQPNTPVSIAPGTNQTFVISLTPAAAFSPTDVRFGFNCTNTDLAPTVVGLNTLLLTASETPAPDIVALAATLNHDGIVDVPGATGTGVFAIATSNVGSGGSITASADTGAASLPVSISLCQTDPMSGACFAAPAGKVTAQINANSTPTFAIFVAGHGAVPFDPANNRAFVRFRDAGGVTRGATSVAVRTR